MQAKALPRRRGAGRVALPRRLVAVALVIALAGVLPPPAVAQSVLHGSLVARDAADEGAESYPLTGIWTFATPAGSRGQSLSFRTWETQPAGWYRLAGPAASYTLLFSSPHSWARPFIATNQTVRAGDDVNLRLSTAFDLAQRAEAEWDPRPARGYFQTFIAASSSVTHVGFKLATDGVDGPGPLGQDILVSIVRAVDGLPPRRWPSVGPARVAPRVDCGGPKSYSYSVGWSSGEVRLERGERYAVHLRPRDETRRVQAFWGPGQSGELRRAGGDDGDDVDDPAALDRRIWITIDGDGDGLLIPYAKRVHASFPSLTRMARRWTQSWVAQGESLAGAVVYCAVSGAQPPLARQRARMTVREEGPDGAIVGVAKIAVGAGDYTGDASWGAFGAAWTPGEAPLVPGRVYALDVESIENFDTLDGFVNIKGQVSDGRPGFNPYRKAEGDEEPAGEAWMNGAERVDFDLDMQIVEYEHAAGSRSWSEIDDGPDLIAGGDFEARAREGGEDGGDVGAARSLGAWARVETALGGAVAVVDEPERPANGLLRIQGGEKGEAVADGVAAQRAGGLDRGATYRLSLRARSTWAPSDERGAWFGIDPTGQVESAEAPTIEWHPIGQVHGIFEDWTSPPIRPARDAIAVFLRARQTKPAPFPFRADFDDVRLRRIADRAPRGIGADWTPLFDGATLAGLKVLIDDDFEGRGAVAVEGGELRLAAGQPSTGVAVTREDVPREGYEVAVEAKRTEGGDFFCGLTFPVGESWCTFVVGGWGGGVVGLSNVDHMAAADNETSSGRAFDDDTWYAIRLRVTPAKIQAWIDDESVVDLERAGRKFDIWWQQEPVRPLGISTWRTGAALRGWRIRRVGED